MSVAPIRLAARLAAAAVGVAGLTGCSSDDNMGPSSPLVGTWNATSFQALGQNLIALGMDLRLSLTNSDSYVLEVTQDLTGVCGTNPSCTETGEYTATAAQITLNPGTDDAVTFNYVIQGTTLTLTGTIEGNPVTVTFSRA